MNLVKSEVLVSMVMWVFYKEMNKNWLIVLIQWGIKVEKFGIWRYM